MRIISQILTTLILATLLGACEQKGSLDSTKQRAQAEQEAGKDVDNRNLEEKARRMETDLTARHEFYGALAGVYEGNVKVEDETYKIKIILTKSLAAYTGDRVRQLSEIESDLLNLYLHVQIVQWHPADTATAVGCRINGIRPDMIKGTLAVTATDCPNSYSIFLSEKEAKDLGQKELRAEKVASDVRNKQTTAVQALVGTIQPSSNAHVYNFVIGRVP